MALKEPVDYCKLLAHLVWLHSQKTHRGGLGLCGLVHEEDHLSFFYSA